jgi:DNA repair protein RadC
VLRNHSSGDPAPSRADIEMTQAIVAVARPPRISVHDRIIVGKDGHASLVDPGRLRRFSHEVETLRAAFRS